MKNTIKYVVVLLLLGYSSRAYCNEEDSALENYNRAVFSFNQYLDDYVMKPVAKGYRAITTPFVRERVHDFFANLKEPASMINHALQGNLADSGKSGGRFLINSTLGLLGTFDVAGGWGIADNKTGFDHTLAAWCVPDGPFFVLPVLGPSTPRATVGYAADVAASPLYWSSYMVNFEHDWQKYSVYYGLSALGFISLREENLELMDKLTAGSVDPYSLVKSAYMQNRLKIGTCKTGDETPSYDFDFDDDDYDDE